MLDFFREGKSEARELDDRTRDFLFRYNETFKPGKVVSVNIHEMFLREATFYLRKYSQKNAALEQLEGRRKDHWDIVNKKCNEDPMFKELWGQILVLLRLEE
jgi:hypothetical protein